MGTLEGTNIGFIGLGPMGKHMALRIKEAGANLFAYHGSPSVRYELAREGISLCVSPKEIAHKTSGGIILLMLGSTKDMEEILLGEAGLVANIGPDTLVIDTSQTPLTSTRHYADLVSQQSAHWIDAPVVGDELAAGKGELMISAGGTANDYQRALAVLQCLGSDISHAGDVGAGQSHIIELGH
ncbi:NAD(P)-dependent oxidoreductase [Sneathiella glossodoripedis]|uniref:NAD(P)-dependent oxidoreductase n=1 Tax=Sneathiella glossodoripedis TaxID=418853 RepID=UPI000472AF64|nr:NAD(P)-binding domain-containing protein [Sneathiella glossodoripedis]